MDRRAWLGAVALTSLLMAGCAASGPAPGAEPEIPGTHSMEDGTVMSGSAHEGHGLDHPEGQGPSPAAEMVCSGQVVDSVRSITGMAEAALPASSWDEPTFSCTYDVDGAPLVLSVYDAIDLDQGRTHFEQVQKALPGAEEIEGMAALGMPSFSTGDGVVAFLRDGKTLLVDATALPGGLGAGGNMTQHQTAYAIASAVLVCWTAHD